MHPGRLDGLYLLLTCPLHRPKQMTHTSPPRKKMTNTRIRPNTMTSAKSYHGGELQPRDDRLARMATVALTGAIGRESGALCVLEPLLMCS